MDNLICNTTTDRFEGLPCEFMCLGVDDDALERFHSFRWDREVDRKGREIG